MAKPKAAAFIPAAANKAVRFTEDAAKKEGDERKDEVSVSTTTDKVDKDSEGSYTTIAEVVEDQKVNEEDVKNNQKALDEDQDVVIKNAQVIVEKVFLIEAEQLIVGDDQHIIEDNRENAEAEKERVE